MKGEDGGWEEMQWRDGRVYEMRVEWREEGTDGVKLGKSWRRRKGGERLRQGRWKVEGGR